MKKVLMFVYSILAYLIAFSSILFWIISVSNLVPEISIDRASEHPLWYTLIKNFGLVALFGVQHSIMARPWFKKIFSMFFSKVVERSTFVLVSGLLLFLLVYQWEPLGGEIWSLPEGSIWYYSMYVLFFAGWAILFISTFQINHFDLFGLRQTYLELSGKPYTGLQFKVKGFYNYVRHPLYFGMLMGMWCTPIMSVTHLSLAIGLTLYVLIGTRFEEKDLVREFDDQYREYQKQKPMLVPFMK